MPCKLRIDESVQQDILLYSSDPIIRAEITAFLKSLQENPYPTQGQLTDPAGKILFTQLACGVFITWQVRSIPTMPISVQSLKPLFVKVLAIGR